MIILYIFSVNRTCFFLMIFKFMGLDLSSGLLLTRNLLRSQLTRWTLVNQHF